MRPILIVCSLPDEEGQNLWLDPKHLFNARSVAVRESFADVVRFGQSNVTTVWVSSQAYCKDLAATLCVPHRLYDDAWEVAMKESSTVVFIGGGKTELALFHRLKDTSLFLLPLPLSAGAALTAFKEIQDYFLVTEQLTLLHARSVSEICHQLRDRFIL